MDEGRNREIRRILARIGHKVTELKRVAIGPLALGELPSGGHRPLTAAEVKLLKKFVAGTLPKKVTKKKRIGKSAKSSTARWYQFQSWQQRKAK